jgi:hypothetical protein
LFEPKISVRNSLFKAERWPETDGSLARQMAGAISRMIPMFSGGAFLIDGIRNAAFSADNESPFAIS